MFNSNLRFPFSSFFFLDPYRFFLEPYFLGRKRVFLFSFINSHLWFLETWRKTHVFPLFSLLSMFMLKVYFNVWFIASVGYFRLLSRLPTLLQIAARYRLYKCDRSHIGRTDRHTYVWRDRSIMQRSLYAPLNKLYWLFLRLKRFSFEC